MNNTELETEGTMTVYKKRIIDRINQVQDLGVLQYLDRFLELFLKEWGQ